MRVQVHRHCERHAFAFEGLRWYFTSGYRLVNDLVRDFIISHVFSKPLPIAERFIDLPPLGNEEAFIDVTIASSGESWTMEKELL